MLEQNVFIETVREVEQIIRVSTEPLSKEQILSYFQDMELNEEQKEQIYAYFLTPHPKAEAQEEPKKEETTEEAAETEALTESEAERKALGSRQQNPVPESRVFQLYLEEIEGIRKYDKTELEALYQRLLAGEEAVIRILADAWLYRVYETAKELALSAEDFEDIVQEGNLSLFLTLSELCGSGEGTDADRILSEAVENAMKACITEYAGEEDDENAIIGKISLVNEAKKYLAAQNGKEPSAKELAAYTKMSEKELADILRMIEKANRSAK